MPVSMVRISVRVVHLVQPGRQPVDQAHLVEPFQGTIDRGQIQTWQSLAGLIVDLLSGQVAVTFHLCHQSQ